MTILAPSAVASGTLVDETDRSGAGDPYVTSAVSTTAGRAALLVLTWVSSVAADISLTGWTPGATLGHNSNRYVKCFLKNAANLSAQTISMIASATTLKMVASLYEIQSDNPLAFVQASAFGTGSGTAASCTFGAAPAASSLVVAASTIAGTFTHVWTNMTELHDSLGSGTSPNTRLSTAYDLTSPPTSPAATVSGSIGWGMGAWELAEVIPPATLRRRHGWGWH